MPLRGDLLNPIPGPNPAGLDLRYDPVYDKIKEARHEDDDGPQGDWQRPRKAADYVLVTKLAGDALAARSKDLQLAAWLTEAHLRREGFAGLRAGLGLLVELLERYWECLYPPLEDGDPELRAAPLAWVGLSLIPAIRSVPLNRSGNDFFKYKESRAVGSEADAGGDPKKLQARQQAIDDGKLPAEEFDRGFEATAKSWYKELAADVDGSLEALKTLDRLGREKFGEVAPDFRRLQEAIAEIQQVVRQLLRKKLETDPDPPEPVSRTASSGPGSGADSGSLPESPPEGTSRPAMGYEAADREDATARALAAARFLRRTEPYNPASYLLLRGFRWGEVRAQGGSPDPRLLEAPSTQVRTHLKGLLLEAKWEQLLEASENVMATPAGRGWIDLQRYALTACSGLGGEFDHVARAIRGELRALLVDLPGLSGMSLMDDMPTANQETLQWLHEQGLVNGTQPTAGDEREQLQPSAVNGAGKSVDRVLDRALVEVRAGRPHRGIEALMNELGKEKTPRARFFRRTQITRIMVDAGLEAIAMPILQELLTLIETHRLAEWEAGEVVAEPMALLYRCIEKLPPDTVAGEHTRASLHPRICSLDPLQAMTLTQP
jgi:type VI secretion system protein ImpA